MTYRYEATTVAGFIQQLAVAYLPHGYYFYVTGVIPPAKDPRRVDAKLMQRYGIELSRWTRTRRKAQGLANVHYLRYRRFFVLLATHGQHRFFEDEAATFRDARRSPIRFAGYAVSHHNGHSHVRLDLDDYRWLKASLLDQATRRTAEQLHATFLHQPFEPYAPVRRQLLNLLRAVNRERKLAGLELVPITAIRLRRHIVKPFEVCAEDPRHLAGDPEVVA